MFGFGRKQLRQKNVGKIGLFTMLFWYLHKKLLIDQCIKIRGIWYWYKRRLKGGRLAMVNGQWQWSTSRSGRSSDELEWLIGDPLLRSLRWSLEKFMLNSQKSGTFIIRNTSFVNRESHGNQNDADYLCVRNSQILLLFSDLHFGNSVG